MRSMVVLAVVVGCGYPDLPALDGDAGAQARDDGGCRSFSAQFDSCQIDFAGDLMLGGTLTFDTTAGTLVAGSDALTVPTMTITTQGVLVEALYARTITLAAHTQLRAAGDKPFALIALDAITLADHAAIDVSVGGAGARTSCSAAPTSGKASTQGAGGGGGGGGGASGGDGGNGNSDGFGPSGESPGGSKGAAIAARPRGPRGGCPGAAGGTGDVKGGDAGLGGGALLLSAGGQITLDAATLNAGGGGGGGGLVMISVDGDDGGGGGGAGGMIWLEAAHVVGPLAIVAANGGGGGEGSGNGSAGNRGSAGLASADRAAGGAGMSSTGADGGAGGDRDVPAGDKPSTVLTGGGGGGGGGVGFVVIASADVALGTVSPAAVSP